MTSSLIYNLRRDKMKKNLIAVGTGIVFFHHVICTILYNAPVNPLSATYQKYVSNYMDPFFAQRWLLFAPAPATSDLKLWYRIKANKSWETWLDPLEPVLKRHQQKRFTYNAKLLYVYGNIARDLNIKNVSLVSEFPCNENDSACLKKRNERILPSREFQLAKKYVTRDIAKSFPTKKIDSLQIMIIQLYPKQFSERLTNKPFGYAYSIEFSPVAFGNDN